MGIFLIVGLFIVNSFALNFMSDKKYKLAGMCNIIALCLIIALAAQFNLLGSITIICFVCLAIIIGLKIYLNNKEK